MACRSLFLYIIFCWISFSTRAEEVRVEPATHSIAFSKINEILKPYGAKAALSVRNLRGKVEYSHNSLDAYPPASLAKIFSSACVLNELGPDFRFETPWSYRGKIDGSTLDGYIVVSGSGDFSFVIEDLKMIVEYIRFALGIKTITGKLIFETRFLSKPVMSFSDDFSNDRGRAFSAAITAAPINHNAFSIWVIPEKPRPRIEVLPQDSIDLKIENRLRLMPGRFRGSRTNLDFRIDERKLIMSGQIGASDDLRIYYRALPNPYESFAKLLQYNFNLLGGRWDGSWELKDESAKTGSLWIHRSTNMSRLLIDINKLSTNFGAEMALMAAAHQQAKQPVNESKVTEFLKSCLSSFGLSEKEILLENASGLSRTSKFQPAAMTKFLSEISEAKFFPEFLSSLSVLGQDGTTQSRLQALEGQARLKTGTLRDVRALAGYVFPQRGMPMSMALVLNCGNCDLERWERLEDQILRILIRGT